MDPTTRLRKNILPRSVTDLGACAFIFTSIISIFIYEVFIVAPTLFPHPLLQTFHVLVGTFIVMNIIGNLIGIMVVDTSTRGLIFPTEVLPGWHVCAQCESVAPPRSKHCNTCKTCILKKEHHCIFAGYCVGLSNHRFFYIFLLYMWLSTMYCSVLNAFFIWPYVGGGLIGVCLRIFLPGLWLLWTPSLDTLYTFLFSLNLLGFLFMSVLVYYYTNLLLTNLTTSENTYNRQSNGNKYDYGRTKNIEVALGSRWYLTWMAPFLSSPLPYDGLDWSKPKGNMSRAKFN